MAKTDRLSEFVKEEPILWHDRRRYLGLPISFTRYSFDNNKFYVKRGLFNTISDEILLYRVLDIRLSRSLWQKIFRVGTIILKTADQTVPNLEIKSVKDSERVKTALSRERKKREESSR